MSNQQKPNQTSHPPILDLLVFPANNKPPAQIVNAFSGANINYSKKFAQNLQETKSLMLFGENAEQFKNFDQSLLKYDQTDSSNIQNSTQAVIREFPQSCPIITCKDSGTTWKKTDVEQAKKAIDNSFLLAAKKWNTGQFNKIYIPLLGIGVAGLQNGATGHLAQIRDHLRNRLKEFETWLQTTKKSESITIPQSSNPILSFQNDLSIFFNKLDALRKPLAKEQKNNGDDIYRGLHDINLHSILYLCNCLLTNTKPSNNFTEIKKENWMKEPFITLINLYNELIKKYTTTSAEVLQSTDKALIKNLKYLTAFFLSVIGDGIDPQIKDPKKPTTTITFRNNLNRLDEIEDLIMAEVRKKCDTKNSPFSFL